MYTHEIFTFQDPTEMEKAAKKSRQQQQNRKSSGSNVVGELSHTQKKKQKSTLKYIKKHFTISINKSNIFWCRARNKFWVSTTLTKYILYAWFRNCNKLIESFFLLLHNTLALSLSWASEEWNIKLQFSEKISSFPFCALFSELLLRLVSLSFLTFSNDMTVK